MDLLTHIVSGAAAGTILCPVNKKNSISVPAILAGAAGGAVPDIDALSLWSGFDKYIAPVFQITRSGKTLYFGKDWYSHHGFFHSLAAGALISIFIFFVIYITTRLKEEKLHRAKHLRGISSFYLGYIAHLAGDIPTPSCVLGGVNLLWPSKEYVGGTGSIWWWNNYDLFIIILTGLALNILLITLLYKLNVRAARFSLLIPVLTLTMVLFQISNRKNDYAYRGFTPAYNQLEKKSLNEQKEVLGERIYRIMTRLDRRINIHF